MEKNVPQLKDGSEWAHHEDCIVGDKAGLENLIRACETALKDGEYYGDGLGDYVGVKKLDSEWFKEPKDSPSTRFGSVIVAVVVSVVIALLFIGVGTVFKWAF